MKLGTGFRVRRSKFQLPDLGFEVWGLGFRVQGLGTGVGDWGFRVKG